MTRQDYHAQRRKTLKCLNDAAFRVLRDPPERFPERTTLRRLDGLMDDLRDLKKAADEASGVLEEWPQDADGDCPEVVYDVGTTAGRWLARFADASDAEAYRALWQSDSTNKGHAEVREVAL